MHRQYSIQPTTLFATLLMLAMSALGLQSTLFQPANQCGCLSQDAVEVAAAEVSCCGQAQPSVADCCETQESSPACCCTPREQGCECPGCECSEGGNLPLNPALPIHESTKIVATTTLGASAGTGLRPWRDRSHATLTAEVPEHVARTSLQTCVRLSRFTC